ncbi:hypothetical protein [Naasia lichenicola]|uniref:hypothetical protein n=1 Tax=Naasia lichenicola TaxID=2565933 RepID=UPI00130DFEA2|nr:hypothetical protein [Naasia lichenicola]
MITTINWNWLFETTTDGEGALAVALGVGIVEMPAVETAVAALRTRELQAA